MNDAEKVTLVREALRSHTATCSCCPTLDESSVQRLAARAVMALNGRTIAAAVPSPAAPTGQEVDGYCVCDGPGSYPARDCGVPAHRVAAAAIYAKGAAPAAPTEPAAETGVRVKSHPPFGDYLHLDPFIGNASAVVVAEQRYGLQPKRLILSHQLYTHEVATDAETWVLAVQSHWVQVTDAKGQPLRAVRAVVSDTEQGDQ